VTDDGTVRTGMRIDVDLDLCCGHALCVDVAPELFEMRDDDKAYVIGDPTAAAAGEAREAERVCPQMAITVSDA
jgi:ferredoxin